MGCGDQLEGEIVGQLCGEIVGCSVGRVFTHCVQWPGNVIVGGLIRTEMFVQCLPIVFIV